MSGADAWVARDSPAAGRAAAEAVLNCEIGVEDACEATGGRSPQERPYGRKPARDLESPEREAAPEVARSAAEAYLPPFP
jgi:hypothetical protein